MILWIDSTDLHDALAQARFTEFPDQNVLNDAAFTASIEAQAVITQSLSPSLPALDANGKVLGEIERGCSEAVDAVLRRLPPLPPDADPRQAVRDRLKRSRDPVIVAVCDAAASEGTRSASMSGSATTVSGPSEADRGAQAGRIGSYSEGADALADALWHVGQLRDWAAAAREQHEAGRKREADTRHPEDSRPRAFAFALIEAYRKITDRRPAFSRRGGEWPAGRLIDYLVLLFERARKKLEADPAQAHVANERGWSPSLETLALWIRQYREGRQAEPQTAGQTPRK